MKLKFSILAKYEAFYTDGKVQFTQDGEFMLCSHQESLKIIRVSTGKIEGTIGEEDSDTDIITSFILTDDDTNLILAARHGMLTQWNFKEKCVTRKWKSTHTGPVSCMAYDSSSNLLATGGCDSIIKVWDISNKYCTHHLKGAQGVFSTLHFYHKGANMYIIGAADDYKIRVWDLDNSQCIVALDGHYSKITSIVLHEKKKKLLSSSRDKVVLVWDLDNFTIVRTIPTYESIESLVLLPEGLDLPSLHVDGENLHFLSAGEKGILKVWNASTGKCLFQQEDSLISLPDDHEGDGQAVISQASYNAALNAISVVTFDHHILLYRIDDFSIVKQFSGFNGNVCDIKFMGEGDSHIAVATNSPHIKVFELATFNCQLLKGHTDTVVSLDVFPMNRNILVSGSKDNKVCVWEMDKLSHEVCCIYIGTGHTHTVSAVACSRRSLDFLLSVSEDHTLKVWDIPVEKPSFVQNLHLTARCTERAHEKNINSVCISSNNQLIATGSRDNTAKVWQSGDLSLVGTMRGHQKGVWCVEFSPVDLVLATSSGDGTIRLWSLSDFSNLRTFQGHSSEVLKVLFLSQGLQLLSSASDGLIKLWNIKNNSCVQTLSDHENNIWALALSSNEEILISGDIDSSIIIWKDTTEEDEKERHNKMKNCIVQEQNLSNLVHEKKWLKAFGIAITLEWPSKTLEIAKEICLEKDGQLQLQNLFLKLSSAQQSILINYAIEWIKRSKHKIIAALILRTMLKNYTQEEMLANQNICSNLESIKAFCSRYYNEAKNLRVQSSLLDYLIHNMKFINENDQLVAED